MIRKKKKCRLCTDGKEKYLYSKDLCAYHYRLSHRPKPLKRTPLNKVSKKRSGELREYKAFRKKFLETHPCCALRLPDCTHCDPNQLTIHHRRGRENDKLNDVEDWLAVCLNCHRYIHDNDSWARQEGYLLDKID